MYRLYAIEVSLVSEFCVRTRPHRPQYSLTLDPSRTAVETESSPDSRGEPTARLSSGHVMSWAKE